MRIARFSVDGTPAFGVVEGDPGQEQVTVIDGHPFGAVELTSIRFPLGDVRLVAPVLPSKVIGIGRNYADHAKELGNEIPDEPVVFLKPSTSVIGPGEPVRYPMLTQELHHEGELGVVVGRLVREVPIERAHEAILGYTCANDITARDLQRTDNQWTRAKGFDSFCPLGPWIETDLDAGDVLVECLVNDVVRQSARTSLLLRGIPELIAYVSAFMTLLPGDVILTGTPTGVGPLEVGDTVTVAVEGVGELTNTVVSGG